MLWLLLRLLLQLHLPCCVSGHPFVWLWDECFEEAMLDMRLTQGPSDAKDAAEKGAERPGASLHNRALHPDAIATDNLICPAKAQPGENQQGSHLQQQF